MPSAGDVATQRQEAMRSARQFLECLSGLLVLIGLSLTACKDPPKPAASSPPPVKVAPVIERDVPIYREWIGTTVGYVTAQIRPKVSGYLVTPSQVTAVAGHRVRRPDRARWWVDGIGNADVELR